LEIDAGETMSNRGCIILIGSVGTGKDVLCKGTFGDV